MTTLERNPIAFFFRPLSMTESCAGTGGPAAPGTATLSVAMFSLSSSGADATPRKNTSYVLYEAEHNGRNSQNADGILYLTYKEPPGFLTKGRLEWQYPAEYRCP